MIKEINSHFEDFLFHWDKRFYFLVGGYGSSKSYNVALKLILKLLKEKRKCLIVRDVYATIKDSCYDLLKEIAIDIGLEGIVKFSKSPLEITFPNGSQIIFRGLDDPQKLKSINNVSIIWIEECSEITYAAFKELNGRLRTKDQSMHIILSTNPVSKSNWSYKHFFENLGIDDNELYEKRTIETETTYYHHSTCDDNYFLPQSYIEQLDELAIHDPDLHRIARKGHFGVNGRIVLPQFTTAPHHKVIEAIKEIPEPIKRVGFDFGFETSYNALYRLAINHEEKILYIYWEYYKNKMTDDKTAIEIEEFKRTRELIRADQAEPKTIAYYRQQGFNIIGAKKFQGSRLQNTKKVKRFKKIICSEDCPNAIRELKELTYKVDKDGNIIEDEFNIDPHSFSAIWYGLDEYEVSDLKGAMAYGSAVETNYDDMLQDNEYYDDYFND